MSKTIVTDAHRQCAYALMHKYHARDDEFEEAIALAIAAAEEREREACAKVRAAEKGAPDA